MTTYQARIIHQIVEAGYAACQNDPQESPARQHELGEAAVAARNQYLRLRRAEEESYIAAHPEVVNTGRLAVELPPDVDRGFALEV